MLTNFNVFLKDGDIGLKMYSFKCRPNSFMSTTPQDFNGEGVCETSTGMIPVFKERGYVTRVSPNAADGYGGYYLADILLSDASTDDLANDTISRNNTQITEIIGTHHFNYSNTGLSYQADFNVKFWNTQDGNKSKVYSFRAVFNNDFGATFQSEHQTTFEVSVIPGVPGISTARHANTAELPLFIIGRQCVYLRPMISADRLQLVMLLDSGAGEVPSRVAADQDAPDGSYIPSSLASTITSNPISDGIITTLTQSKDFANSIVSKVTDNFIAR